MADEASGSGSNGRAGNVRVVCRVRPQDEIEVSRGGKPCVNLSTRSITVVEEDGEAAFTFDKVFGPSSRQEDVFQDVAKPAVQDVMAGYNATIFAYGQTGSGKTFTMEGASIHDDGLRGVIPRTATALFDAIAEADETIEFMVKVSYVEIYCEKIRDLLDEYRTKINLAIREDPETGVYISGVTEQYITGPEELLGVMARGSRNRAVAATGMNSGSSRSHSVFTVEVAHTDITTSATRTGKMVLVDLAGSEMVRKTNATGTQLEEAKKINKSLSALGQVINALTDGRSTHVPFRDSKLTRLLQNSLGGNSKTNLIINVSPSSYNAMETISTCRFGSRAKRMRNRAVVNEVRSAAELEKLVKRLEATLEKRDAHIASLEVGHTSEVVSARNEMAEAHSAETTRLQEQLDEERAEAARLRDENDKLRHTLGEKERMLAEASELVKEAERHVEAERAKVDGIQSQLDEQAAEFDQRRNDLQEQLDKNAFHLEESKLEKHRLEAELERLAEELDASPNMRSRRAVVNPPSSREVFPPAASPRASSSPTATSHASPLDSGVDGGASGAATGKGDSVALQDTASSNPRVPQDTEGPDPVFLKLLADRDSQLQSRLEVAERQERDSAAEKVKLVRRLDEAEAQKEKLVKDLALRCERVAALEQVLGANAYAQDAGASASPENARGQAARAGVGPHDQVRLLQQRLEQLVAVHRKLLGKYARLELDCQEKRSRVTLRDERIAQLEFHARQMGASMRQQAQRHVEEIQKLRGQVGVLREEQREQAAQARHLAAGGRASPAPSRGGRTEVRAVRGGYNPFATGDATQIKRTLRGGGLATPPTTSATTRAAAPRPILTSPEGGARSSLFVRLFKNSSGSSDRTLEDKPQTMRGRYS